jgi:hypothetical protein
VKSFGKQYPKGRDLTKVTTALDLRRWNNATQVERDHMTAKYRHQATLLPVTEPVDDPDLAYALEVYAAKDLGLVAKSGLEASVQRLLAEPKAKGHGEDPYTFKAINDRYPILTHTVWPGEKADQDVLGDHLRTYVNARFALKGDNA